MKRTLLNLLFLVTIGALFHISTVSAQSKKLDSLYAVLKTQKEDTNKVNALNKICYILEDIGSDSHADSLNRITFDLAGKLNYKAGLAEAYKNQGFIYLDKGNYSEALNSQLQCLKINQDIGNKKGIANAFGNIGSAYQYLDNYPEALNYQMQALEKDKEISNKAGISATYNNIGILYNEEGNYPEALKNLLLALPIDRELGDSQGVAYDYISIGNVYFQQADYPNALKYQLQALDINKQLGNKRSMCNNYINLGNIYSYQGNYPEALKYHLKALKIDEDMQDKHGMAGDYGNIGNIYHELGNIQEALKYYSQALSLDSATGDKEGIAAAYDNLGGIYFGQGDYKKALNSQKASLEIALEIGNKEQIGNSYANIGTIYSARGDYAEALKNQLQALSIYKSTGLNYGVSNSYQSIGSIYIGKKDYTAAKKYTDSALTVSKKAGNKDVIKSAYYNMALVDSAMGNYHGAFNDYKNYIGYRDSLINEKNTKKLVQEQMQYNFDKQQSTQKAEQDKKDALAAQDRKKQVIIRNFFVAGFVLVLVLAFFIFWGYREKQRANEIITKQKEEVEQQKELVEEKQKEIVDSIHYAERIQKALLASEDLLKENLPEYFILYKPKDIVSGDFYWATKKDSRFYLAVCDSTGHGVPGAFMSLLNISFLNEAINEKGISEPNKVLDHIRKRLIENISQEGGQDGMDGVLVKIKETKEGKELRYAAAYNKPIIIRDDVAIELEADKMPVGKSPKDGEGFREYTVSLQKGDMIYLYTDGYGDQFGGEKGKKYKYTQLKEKLKTMSKGSMEEQRKILDKEFESWRHMLEQTDDVCVMGIKV